MSASAGSVARSPDAAQLKLDSDAPLVTTRTINAGGGEYRIGAEPTLIVNRRLQAEQGEYRISGETDEVIKKAAPMEDRLRTTSPLRDRVAEAESLTRFLSRMTRAEVGRLKQSRVNDQAMVDFLTAASTILDQIAESLCAARVSEGAEREQALAQAETQSETLVETFKGFAERHQQRIVDFGGHTRHIAII